MLSDVHPPLTASCGSPFVLVQLRSEEALGRCSTAADQGKIPEGGGRAWNGPSTLAYVREPNR